MSIYSAVQWSASPDVARDVEDGMTWRLSGVEMRVPGLSTSTSVGY